MKFWYFFLSFLVKQPQNPSYVCSPNFCWYKLAKLYKSFSGNLTLEFSGGHVLTLVIDLEMLRRWKSLKEDSHHSFRICVFVSFTYIPKSRIAGSYGSPLQYSCLENPRDGSLMGSMSMGSHMGSMSMGSKSMGSQKVGHDWRDLAAAAW